MLVVVTTDYPLEPGEPIDFLRPAVEESFNSISVDGDARRTTRCRCSRTVRAGRAEPERLEFAPVLDLVCGDACEDDRRRRRGRDRLREIAVPAPHAESKRGRSPPRRDLAAREDGRSSERRELGPYARRGRLRKLQRRLRRLDPDLRERSPYNGTTIIAERHAVGDRARRSAAKQIHDRAGSRPR